MIDELGELPAPLRELIAAEHARVPPAGFASAVRAKLAVSVATTGAASAVALKVLLVVAVVGGAAAGITTLVPGRTVASAAPELAPATPAREVMPMPETRVAVVDVPEPRVEASPRPAPSPTAAPSPAAPEPVIVAPPPPSDPALLADALRALAAHDPARALELATQDTALYPASPLDEERDAIRIRALAALGRASEARPLAAAFVAAHPHSIHRHLVENLQESP